MKPEPLADVKQAPVPVGSGDLLGCPSNLINTDEMLLLMGRYGVASLNKNKPHGHCLRIPHLAFIFHNHIKHTLRLYFQSLTQWCPIKFPARCSGNYNFSIAKLYHPIARAIKHLHCKFIVISHKQPNIPSSATPQAGRGPRKRNGGEQ